jgi:uncharacterized protein
MARRSKTNLAVHFVPLLLLVFMAGNGRVGAVIFDDLKAQAQAGNADAQYRVGVAYEEGQDVAMDDAQAVFWFRKAAEQGQAAAERQLGGRYFSGRGVDKNLAEAFRWYSKAAAQGDADAAYNLGVMFDYGIGATNDVAVAAGWYRKAADQNLPEAQNRLAQLYEQGRGVSQDLAEAQKWYGVAAEQGIQEAQAKLRTLPEIPANAAAKPVDRWARTRERAAQGEAAAQFTLGLAYLRGAGVEKDLAAAEKWLRQSAEQGNAKAQFSLGVFYFNQDSLSPTNDVEADKWFIRAEAQHYAPATQARADLEKTLKPEQITEAKAKAAAGTK